MAHTGQTIYNPLSREQITFRTTSAETNGKSVSLDFLVPAGGFPAAPHLHPHQTELFEIHSGAVLMQVGDKEYEVGPGKSAVVPPGTTHYWKALTDGELRMTLTFEPALRTEEFFEDFVEIARAGNTDKRGVPTPLRLAVLMQENPEFLFFPSPPLFVQRARIKLLAPLGRLLGYGRSRAST